MKAKFNHTAKINNIRVLGLIAVLGGAYLFFRTQFFNDISAKIFEKMVFSIPLSAMPVITIILSIPSFAVFIAFMLMSGEITADENGIKAVYGLGGLVFWKKSLDFSDIRFADCVVERRRRSKGQYKKVLVLYVRMTDNKVQDFVSNLNFPLFLDGEGSSEYDNFIADQPLMKICKYINEMAGKR